MARYSVERGPHHRRRRVVRYGLIATVLALIITSVVFADRYSGTNHEFIAMNVPAPQFALPTLVRSSTRVSSQLLEGRAVVLNFWASWCPPCQAEMPTLEAAHRALGNQVTFIGIDERDSRAAAIAFTRQVRVTYVNGFDANGSVAQAYLLSGTPETYFMSYGKELDISLGPVTDATLRSYLKEVFGIRWSP